MLLRGSFLVVLVGPWADRRGVAARALPAGCSLLGQPILGKPAPSEL